MTTPINTVEINKFKAFERKVQHQLDVFYKQIGWDVKRDSQRTHDLWVNGVKIEEKIRSEIRNDLAIEICQDILSGNRGWFSTVKAVGVFYVMCENSIAVKLFSIHWYLFQHWLIENYLPTHPIGQYIASVKGYGATVNLKIPIAYIPCDIYDEYDIVSQLSFKETP